jgi:predicted nucleic acid-binding protein
MAGHDPMIVVDTNVIAYLHLPSPQSSQAEQCLLKDADWVAPLLWRSEFRNILALYVRQQLLTLDAAQKIAASAEQLMAGHEYEVTSAAVLALAAANSSTAYDCEFLALAQSLNVPFVTVDRQLLARFPATAVALADFSATQPEGKL